MFAFNGKEIRFLRNNGTENISFQEDVINNIQIIL